MGGSGGGSTTTTVDKAFNRGLLSLYQDAADLSEEYDNLYKYGNIEGVDDSDSISGMEYDIASIQAQYSLLGDETEAARSDLETQIATNEATQSAAGYSTLLDSEKTALASSYFDAATSIDPEKEADEAQAGVQQSYKSAMTDAKQQAAMTGVNPSGDAFTSSLTNSALEKTKAIASARQTAKSTAEDQQYSRMSSAMNLS